MGDSPCVPGRNYRPEGRHVRCRGTEQIIDDAAAAAVAGTMLTLIATGETMGDARPRILRLVDAAR